MMSSLCRVRAVLEGRIPDRLPVIPQSFMFAAKSGGYNIGQINRDPAMMAKCHVESWEKFGYDGCIIDVDDAALAEACGASVVYREDSVAVVKESTPCLKDLRDIDFLQMPDPLKDGRLYQWLETTQRVSERIGKEALVMGRADQGPFSLLCLLRGAQQFMIDLITEEENVILHALEWTAKVHSKFAKAQLEAGAHVTSMGDAYASPNLISPAAYHKFAYPMEKQVVEIVQTQNHPYSIHICGDTTKIIEDMGKTHAKILEIDWKLDMGVARRRVPESTILMGNVNPSDPLYLGTPKQVDEKVKEIIEKTKGKGVIISSGCALGANTRPENMTAMIHAAEKYGSFEQLMQLQESSGE